MIDRLAPNDTVTPARLKAKDPEAIAGLVELYSDNIYRTAIKMLGNEQDAEDVLQETILKVLRSIDSFEERSSLSTWIYRITMNEALMLLRKRKNISFSVDSERDDEISPEEPKEIVDWCCLPENELLDDESRGYLDEAVKRLSPALRAVFVLRDIDGLSVRETAETLDISESAVKTRLLRARLQLREDLSNYFGKRIK
jgi:RNA polymerase sigma-70 factor (ECF subfamily)